MTHEELEQAVQDLYQQLELLQATKVEMVPARDLDTGQKSVLFSNDPYGGLLVVSDTDTYDPQTGLGTVQIRFPNNTDTPVINNTNVYPANFNNIPIISGVSWTNNSPAPGSIAWSAFSLTYQGAVYAVNAGNTANKYVWWNLATSSTDLQTGATPPAKAVDQFLVVLNDGGVARPSLFQNIIYSDFISVANLEAVSAFMGNLTIDGLLQMLGANGAIAIGTTPPTSASAGTGLWIDRTGVYGLLSNVVQFKIDAATGKATFGAGNNTIDTNGMNLKISTVAASWVRWLDAAGAGEVSFDADLSNSHTNLTIHTLANDSAHGYTGSRITLWAQNHDDTQSLSMDLHASDTKSGIIISDLMGTLGGVSIGTGLDPTEMLDVAGAIKLTGQLKSTLAAGTAPLVVASTTAVANLNADTVDGKHASDLTSKSVLGGRMSATLAAGATVYLPPFGPPITAGGETTDGVARLPMPFTGVLSNLYVDIGAVNVNANIVVTVMVDGVAASLTKTIASGSAAGVYSDTINAVNVTAAHLVSIRVQNTGAANMTANIKGWSMQYTPS